MSRPVTDAMVAAVAAAAGRRGSPYATLGVARDASPDAVRRAFRRAALALHPDKNGAPGADEEFRRAARAFEVLGDARRRREYDLLGAGGLFGDLGAEEGDDGGDGDAAGWDQEAFDAAPLKVKLQAFAILLLVLALRFILWALVWVVSWAAAAARFVLRVVVTALAVVFVVTSYAYQAGCWLCRAAVEGAQLAAAGLALVVLDAARRAHEAVHPPRRDTGFVAVHEAPPPVEPSKARRALRKMRLRRRRDR